MDLDIDRKTYVKISKIKNMLNTLYTSYDDYIKPNQKKKSKSKGNKKPIQTNSKLLLNDIIETKNQAT